MTKIRDLLDRRATLHDESAAILKRAEDEHRDLTDQETSRCDRNLREIRQLTTELQRRELEDLRNGIQPWNAPCLSTSPEFNGYPPDAAFGEGYSYPGGEEDDESEVRALRPNESLLSYLAKRGRLFEPEAFRGLSLGRYLRSMVLGPRTEAEKRALSEGTDSAGGFTVPEILSSQLIDLMRKKTRALQAGARLVPLDSEKHRFARIASDPVPAWRAENAVIAESEPTFDSVLFEPKTLAVVVKASRELLEDSVNLNQALPMVFASAMARELDRVALIGTGVAPQPRGIANTTGVNSFSMGTNGLAITDYDPFVSAIQLVLEDNGEIPDTAIMAPRTFGAVGKFIDTTDQPLQRPPILANLRLLDSTQLPINETQGTSNNASRIILGGFRSLWVGVRTEVRVEILRERFADNLQYGFVVWARYDVQLEHPESFTQVVGIIP